MRLRPCHCYEIDIVPKRAAFILTCLVWCCSCVFCPWQYVYELFVASAAFQILLAGCSYSYFVLMWNQHCPQIRLKKTMRFTKCDICVMCTESLDVARRNGGGGWETAAMSTIKRSLEDHYSVRSQHPLVVCSLLTFLVAIFGTVFGHGCDSPFSHSLSPSLALSLIFCLPVFRNVSPLNVQYSRMSIAAEGSI